MQTRMLEGDICSTTKLSLLTRMLTTSRECLNFKAIKTLVQGRNDFQETWNLEMHPHLEVIDLALLRTKISKFMCPRLETKKVIQVFTLLILYSKVWKNWKDTIMTSESPTGKTNNWHRHSSHSPTTDTSCSSRLLSSSPSNSIRPHRLTSWPISIQTSIPTNMGLIWELRWELRILNKFKSLRGITPCLIRIAKTSNWLMIWKPLSSRHSHCSFTQVSNPCKN